MMGVVLAAQSVGSLVDRTKNILCLGVALTATPPMVPVRLPNAALELKASVLAAQPVGWLQLVDEPTILFGI